MKQIFISRQEVKIEIFNNYKNIYYKYFCKGQITHKRLNTNFYQYQIIQRQNKLEWSYLFTTHRLNIIYPPVTIHESNVYCSGHIIVAKGRSLINEECGCCYSCPRHIPP